MKDDGNKDTSVRASIGAVKEALANDLDTPRALAVIDQAFGMLGSASSASDIHRTSLTDLLESIDELLGIDLVSTTGDIDDDVKRLILERQRARESKDYAESDRLRSVISFHGIALNDTPTGTIWSYED